jgi:hypothetical protein
LIGEDAASIAGIVRVTALRIMTNGMATMATTRLMLVECWGLLSVVNVKAVEGACIHEEWRMSVGACGWLSRYTTSACGIFFFFYCV